MASTGEIMNVIKNKRITLGNRIKKITRRTIGAHGYNLLQNELLSLAILWYNMLSNNRYLVSSFGIL